MEVVAGSHGAHDATVWTDPSSSHCYRYHSKLSASDPRRPCDDGGQKNGKMTMKRMMVRDQAFEMPCCSLYCCQCHVLLLLPVPVMICWHVSTRTKGRRLSLSLSLLLNCQRCCCLSSGGSRDYH